MAQYEGRWRCDYCDGENLGRDRNCRNCGTSIGENVSFYLPKDAKPLQDGKLIAEAKSGVAWHCDHCETMNLNIRDGLRVTSCRTCGNARDSADRNRVVRDAGSSGPLLEPKRAADRDASGWSGDPRQTSMSEMSSEALASQGPDRSGSPSGKTGPDLDRRPSKRRLSRRPDFFGGGGMGRHARAFPKRMTALIGAGLIAVLLILSLFIPVSTRDADILHAHWERAMSVEELQTFQKSGFNPPSDARIHDRDWRFSHTVEVPIGTKEVPDGTRQVPSGTRQVACGTTDNGNGYFSTKYCSETVYTTQAAYRTETVYRTDRVYDWHYEYEVDRWVDIRRRETRGVDEDPYWPDLTPVGSRQRLGKRSESYAFEIDMGQDDTRSIEVPYPRWSKAGSGDGVAVRINLWGRVLRLAE